MEAAPTAKKSKPGPKTGIFGNHFTNHGQYCATSKRFAKLCKYCRQIIPADRAKPERLAVHLLETCRDIDQGTRDSFIQERSAELSLKRARDDVSGQTETSAAT